MENKSKLKKIVRVTTVPSSLKILLRGQLRFMTQYYDIIGVASPFKELEEVKEQEGIRVYPVNMTRTIAPFKDLMAAFRLYRFLRKERPYIVHTHTPKAGIVGMLAAWLAGVKHRYHTVAGMPLLEARGLKRKLLNLVEKATYLFATRVFPNSKGQYQIILDEGFAKAEKLMVIGKGSSNGIDVDHFNPELVSTEEKNRLRKQFELSEGTLVYVYVGRLVKDKGINELVYAFNEISNADGSCKLMLVGSREDHLDPLLPETEERIGSHPDIISAGWQNDIRPYLMISDVFVFPTYREGFPNVVMQAGAMGLPSIVTDINGCNEIVENQYNGLVIPPKDKTALVDAMRFLMDKDAERRKMASVARENIVVNYRHTYIWDELLKVYQTADQPHDLS